MSCTYCTGVVFTHPCHGHLVSLYIEMRSADFIQCSVVQLLTKRIE